jgi:hypothetical protein
LLFLEIVLLETMALHKPFIGERYGEVFEGKRAPFNNLQGKLEGPLVSLLYEKVMLQLRNQLGKNRLMSANQAHVADWHAVTRHAATPMQIFVPRPGGGFKPTPSANPTLMAFATAFRATNVAIFQTMVERLRRLDSDLAQIIADTIEQDRHLGVCEVQFFHGTRNRKCGWHIDGATSILHFAVTLAGERDLSVEYAENSRKHAACSKETKRMHSGDVYLSSPYLFNHGVHFRESKKPEDGSLSIQMRMGYTSKSQSKPAFNHNRGGQMRKVAEVISGVLNESLVQVPTLADVEFWSEQLQSGSALKRKQPEEVKKTVSLKGFHDRYLTAHPQGKLRAEASVKQAWEEFSMEEIPNGAVSFKSHHGKYATAHPDGRIEATANKRRAWEEFQVEWNHNGTASFRSHHGKYFTAHSNHKVTCGTRVKQAWEEFRVEMR